MVSVSCCRTLIYLFAVLFPRVLYAQLFILSMYFFIYIDGLFGKDDSLLGCPEHFMWVISKHLFKFSWEKNENVIGVPGRFLLTPGLYRYNDLEFF